ncbi:HIRA B motif [Nesidiocoris tenuis]|uniref:Protein HIRA n=1 Tax=Nesidiocoris tenuis TaxID=355587 RepID=A0ABN7B8F9_9HEMI|nr:HIRA B motif [Nesidiocoris tenuis]
MKVFKPDWIHHDGTSICSIDIHPDGSRVATGGQGVNSGRIVIWNMAPVIHESVEADESVPKMLCQLDNHLACVNCVRWSYSGKYLASGGDDKLVMIWTISKSLGSNSVFGSRGKVNVEGWRCSHTLRSHNGDVLDMAWSQYDQWLATCSVDNTIIVWRADNFPEKVTVLRGHTGLVKGVSWDPVGKYLGSQSDDKTVRIWRTCDWSTETVIKKPFERCAGTTMVLRLSWSPDGQILVTAHAMNGDGPTAQIVERDGWEHSKDMVGHGKAVTCTRYSPAITETTRKGRKLQSCTCALGSRDMSVSIWTTSMERPIVVIKDIFSKPVVDLGWSSNGRYLMACSADGSTVFMEFSSDEIGHAISEQQRASILEQMYGKFTVGRGSELLMIENPEVLIHSEKHRKRSAKLESILAMDDKKLADSTNSTSAPSEGGVANGSSQLQSLSASNNNTPGEDNHISSKEPARTKKQIETRTSDGRRRITPIFIPLNVESSEETPLPFSSDSMPSFSSCPSKSRIIIEKRDDVVVAPNVTTPVKSSANQSSTPSKCSTPTMNATLTQSPKIEPSPSTTVFSGLVTAVEKSKSATKRPRTLTLCSGSRAKKTKVTREAPPASEPKKPPARPVLESRQDMLPPLCMLSSRRAQLSKTRNFIDIENSRSGNVSLVRMISPDAEEKPVWEMAIGGEVCGCVGTGEWVALACADSTLRFVDARHGSYLVPAVCLGSVPAYLSYSNSHVVSITAAGNLTLWRVTDGQPVAVLYDKSLAPLVPSEGELKIKDCFITDSGQPIVSLTCGKAFMFSTDINCWLLMADSGDSIMKHTHLNYKTSFRNLPSASSQSLPLRSVQMTTCNGLNVGVGRVTVGSEVAAMCTVTHLDAQVSAAKVLNSKAEYKFWLLTLVRFLVLQGLEYRLRCICEELLGPAFSSVQHRTSTDWESTVLGLHKHNLLQDVLQEMSSNMKLQRLYTEIVSQLELVRSKAGDPV